MYYIERNRARRYLPEGSRKIPRRFPEARLRIVANGSRRCGMLNVVFVISHCISVIVCVIFVFLYCICYIDFYIISFILKLLILYVIVDTYICYNWYIICWFCYTICLFLLYYMCYNICYFCYIIC